jgi:hypothetical protein
MPVAPLTVARVRSLFVWDKSSLRYRDASGRFVKASEIQDALQRVVKASKRLIVRLSEQMASGSISVGQWQQGMEAAVKDLHLAATATAKGGFGAMTARDYGLTGARLRNHYERLDSFAQDIEANRMTPGQIKARGQLYASAGNGVYQNARREAAHGVMTEERRVLGNAEHCDVCVEESAKGWSPLGTLKRLGDSPCRANCKCQWRFRKQSASDTNNP